MKKTKPLQVTLRIRKWIDGDLVTGTVKGHVDVWLINDQGMQQSGLLFGQMLPETAERLADLLRGRVQIIRQKKRLWKKGQEPPWTSTKNTGQKPSKKSGAKAK